MLHINTALYLSDAIFIEIEQMMMSSERKTVSSNDATDAARPSLQIWLVGILTFMTITAAAMLHVNQPEFILDRFTEVTDFEYALFDGVLYLSYLTIGLLLGVVSDRWGRRRLFVIVGATGSILFYWLLTTAQAYPILLGFRFLQGSFTVMVWQSLMVLALDFSVHGERGRNMGVFGIFLALAMGVGPAVGGLVASYGVFMPYFVAILLNVTVLFTAIIGLKEPQTISHQPSFRASLSIVKREPKLIVPGLFNFTDRLHIGFILTALPLFLSTTLALSESLRGLSLAVFAFPFILLQYPMGRLSDRYGRYRQLFIGSVGYGIILSLFGIFGAFGFVSLLVVLAVLGVFNGITAPPSMALVGDVTKQNDTAMGMGFFNFMGNLGITIGPLLFGYLIVTASFFTAFLIVGSLELITLAFNAILVKFVFNETPILSE
jgi:MFS family permease